MADKMETTSTSQARHSYKDFDLDTYLSNYSGHTKILRAIFIAEHAKDLEAEAYRVALDELKKTQNTVLYKEIADKANDKIGPAFARDQSWMDSVDKKAQQQLERLELELNGYKTNLIKESIRVYPPPPKKKGSCSSLARRGLTHFWSTRTDGPQRFGRFSL